MTTDDMPRSTHACHARGCMVEVPREMMMCAAHWELVPEYIKRRLGTRSSTRDNISHLMDAIEAVAIAERVNARRYVLMDDQAFVCGRRLPELGDESDWEDVP